MKKFILPFLAGWALAILISPRNVLDMFKSKG
jgi:hypothetical protein